MPVIATIVQDWNGRMCHVEALGLPRARVEKARTLSGQDVPVGAGVRHERDSMLVEWTRDDAPLPIVLDVSYEPKPRSWLQGGRLKLVLAIVVAIQTAASAGGAALASWLSRSAMDELEQYRGLSTALTADELAGADPACKNRSALSPSCLAQEIAELRSKLKTKTEAADHAKKDALVMEDRLAELRAELQPIDSALRSKGKRGCGAPDTSLAVCAQDYVNDWERMAKALGCDIADAKKLFDCLGRKVR